MAAHVVSMSWTTTLQRSEEKGLAGSILDSTGFAVPI